MPKICEGMVFVMLLGRNSHLYSMRDTMEKLYGYDRMQTTKWTNHMLEYLFDQWAFLLDLNEELCQTRWWSTAHSWARKQTRWIRLPANPIFALMA